MKEFFTEGDFKQLMAEAYSQPNQISGDFCEKIFTTING